MPIRPRNLKEVAENASNLEAWSSALAEFLDETNARREGSPEELLALILEEPPVLRAKFLGGETADAFGAALAEYLADKFATKSPDWTRKSDRFLKGPWFPVASASAESRLRSLIEKGTPRAFREHNVFIDERSLRRT
jgi:hypothetical protein